MIICISGDYRSGKSGLATHIANKYGLEHYSMRKLIDKSKSRFNVDKVDWNRWLSNLHDEEIENIIYKFAIQGNCVLDFRFSALLCEKFKIEYKGIYINARIEERIKGNMLCWELSAEETRKLIVERESKELKKSFELYGKSYKEPDLYELFFDFSDKWNEKDFLIKGFDYTRELVTVKNLFLRDR